MKTALQTQSSKTVLSKTALSILLAATALTSMSALAHDDTQKHCYPLAHGQDGMGSSNSIHIPFMRTKGNWQSMIYLTNTSDKNLNVKITLRKHNGDVYTPTQTVIAGSFSPTNSPFDNVVGGAILRPFQTGQVQIIDDNNPDNFTGKVTWQADACLESAMTGAFKAHYWDSSRYDQGLVLFNGGNPF